MPTSAARTCNITGSRRGFTLIEILVVLGIVAAALTIAIPRLFGKRDNDIKAVTRHFMVLGKEVRNRARLQNTGMRIVIDMDPAEPKYWVEKSTAGAQPILSAEEREKRKKAQDALSPDKRKPPPWEIDKVLTRDQKKLPSGLYFASLETIGMQAPLTEGEGYIHFFPEGMMEASALQITDRKGKTWTLIFNPLTGQADISEMARSLKDANK